MSIRKWAAVLAATGALALTGTTAAMASTAGGTPGGTPTPTCSPTVAPAGTPSGYGSPKGSPTVSPQFGYNPCPTPTVPVPTPTVRQQEDFWLDINTFNPNGTVLATGPVRFNTGRDITVSPTRDIFRRFLNSVNVLHPALGGAVVDRAACTITLDQNDQPWAFLRGTGLYRNALGAGVYDLRGEFSFPTRNFVCTIPAGLSSAQAAADLNANGAGLPAPLAFDIAVNGTGWASVSPLAPVPAPSPSTSYWSPTHS
jgi:hypothetical protein